MPRHQNSECDAHRNVKTSATVCIVCMDEELTRLRKLAQASPNSVDDEWHKSPCKHGNIIDGYACYCHCQENGAPRRCPIWLYYGEGDLSKWHREGNFDDGHWAGGCPWFEKTPNV